MSSTISATSGASAAALLAGLVVSVPTEYDAVSPLSNVPELALTRGISGAAVEGLTPEQLAAVNAYGDALAAATGPAITVTNYDGSTSYPIGSGQPLGMGEMWNDANTDGSITGDTAVTLIDTGTTVQTYVGTITAAENAAWESTGSVCGPGVTATPTVSSVPSIDEGAAWLTVIFGGNGPHTLKANLVTDTTNPDGTVTPVTTAVDIEIDGVTVAATPAATPAGPPAKLDAAAPSSTASTPTPVTVAPATAHASVTYLSLSLRSVNVLAKPVVPPGYRGPVSPIGEGAAIYDVGSTTDEGAPLLYGFYTSSASIVSGFAAAPGKAFSAQA